MAQEQARKRFETLLDQHRTVIYNVCRSYCPNRADREDLAQEIVLELWRSFERFDDRNRFSTWLYRVALNVAISFYRRERRRAQHTVPADQHVFDVHNEAADEPDELLALRAFIENLGSLNKGLMLLYLDGYPHKEIGAILGITESNVATKINRLKAAIKNHFSDQKVAK
jgi:RNA polymerase sigma factor (sigma-70 family)